MKSSFLPKYGPNIIMITLPHYRAEILTIFGSYFGRNDDFIKFILKFTDLYLISGVKTLNGKLLHYYIDIDFLICIITINKLIMSEKFATFE